MIFYQVIVPPGRRCVGLASMRLPRTRPGPLQPIRAHGAQLKMASAPLSASWSDGHSFGSDVSGNDFRAGVELLGDFCEAAALSVEVCCEAELIVGELGGLWAKGYPVAFEMGGDGVSVKSPDSGELGD